MKHVYLLQSQSHPGQRYIGSTADLQARIRAHHTGQSPHTSKYAPWEIVVALRFRDDKRAQEFERYLKTGSGHAFAKRHPWNA